MTALANASQLVAPQTPVSAPLQLYSTAAPFFQPQHRIRPATLYSASTNYPYSANYPYSGIYPPAVSFDSYARPGPYSASVSPFGRSYPYNLYAPTYPARQAFTPYAGISPYGTRNSNYPYAGICPSSSSCTTYTGPYPYGTSYVPNAVTYGPSSRPNAVLGPYQTAYNPYANGLVQTYSRPAYAMPFAPSVPSYAIPSPYRPPLDIYGSRHPYESVYINGVWYKPWEIPEQLRYGGAYDNPYDTSYVYAAAEPVRGLGFRHIPGRELYGSRYPYASVYINGVWYKPWEVPSHYNECRGTYPFPSRYAVAAPYASAFNPYASGYPYRAGYDPYPDVYLQAADDSGNGHRYPYPSRNLTLNLNLLVDPDVEQLSLTINLHKDPRQRQQTEFLRYPARAYFPSLGSLPLPPALSAAIPPMLSFNPPFLPAPFQNEMARLPFGVGSTMLPPLPPARRPPLPPPGAVPPPLAGPLTAQSLVSLGTQRTMNPGAESAGVVNADVINARVLNADVLNVGMLNVGRSSVAEPIATQPMSLAGQARPLLSYPSAGSGVTLFAAGTALGEEADLAELVEFTLEDLLRAFALDDLLQEFALDDLREFGLEDLLRELAMEDPLLEVASIAAAPEATAPLEVPASVVDVAPDGAALMAGVSYPAPAAAGTPSSLGGPIVALLAILTGLGMWGLSFLWWHRR
jgi:hypothetical protein